MIRPSLNDTDMFKAREKLPSLDAQEQLLWKLVGTTGMGLCEAFQIAEECREGGIRYVISGTKTASSRRRIPIPEELLPLLPSKITGPLFQGTPASASIRLNRFLRLCGITDERKVLHGLRHRAKDRLLAEAFPQHVQEEIMGYTEKTVARSYGCGSPVALLKTWVDKIGY